MIESLKSELATANTKYKELVDETNKQLAVANKREASVIVKFRKGFVDNGYVAVFSNLSGRTAVITAEMERPSSGKKRSLEMTFDRGTSKELGESEGWAFISGDTVSILQDNHKSMIYTLD